MIPVSGDANAPDSAPTYVVLASPCHDSGRSPPNLPPTLPSLQPLLKFGTLSSNRHSGKSVRPQSYEANQVGMSSAHSSSSRTGSRAASSEASESPYDTSPVHYPSTSWETSSARISSQRGYTSYSFGPPGQSGSHPYLAPLSFSNDAGSLAPENNLVRESSYHYPFHDKGYRHIQSAPRYPIYGADYYYPPPHNEAPLPRRMTSPWSHEYQRADQVPLEEQYSHVNYHQEARLKRRPHLYYPESGYRGKAQQSFDTSSDHLAAIPSTGPSNQHCPESTKRRRVDSFGNHASVHSPYQLRPAFNTDPTPPSHDSQSCDMNPSSTALPPQSTSHGTSIPPLSIGAATSGFKEQSSKLSVARPSRRKAPAKNEGEKAQGSRKRAQGKGKPVGEEHKTAIDNLPPPLGLGQASFEDLTYYMWHPFFPWPPLPDRRYPEILCQWKDANGAVCGEELTRDHGMIPAHFRKKHGIRCGSHDPNVDCQWGDCSASGLKAHNLKNHVLGHKSLLAGKCFACDGLRSDHAGEPRHLKMCLAGRSDEELEKLGIAIYRPDSSGDPPLLLSVAEEEEAAKEAKVAAANAEAAGEAQEAKGGKPNSANLNKVAFLPPLPPPMPPSSPTMSEVVLDEPTSGKLRRIDLALESILKVRKGYLKGYEGQDIGWQRRVRWVPPERTSGQDDD